MNYHDQRFAKDPRFRFFALNSVMGWRAITQGHVCVRRNSKLKNAMVPEMRHMLTHEPNLAKQIMFYGSTLRGTKPFWYKRCGELFDMVARLGAPTLFLTLIAADTHWPDLFTIMDRKCTISGMNYHQANRTRQQLVTRILTLLRNFFKRGRNISSRRLCATSTR